ncbi:MAG: mechanosensitive ion channel family protein [Pseudomonadota bacterium]
MNELISDWVSKLPGISGFEDLATAGIALLGVFFIAGLGYLVVKRILVKLINSFIDKTESDLDDILVKRRVFNRAAYLVPALLIYRLAPEALENYPDLSALFTTLVAIYFVLAIASLVVALIDSLLDIYHTFPVSRQVPIQSFGQVAKLVTYFLAMIVLVSLVVGESPLKLFAGLGAMTAVLMLVFKDPILGFVAGLQLSYNRMVGLGDWVEIPQHQASGDIMEIGLTTVKVRNFDNTITTVPTQNLITDSFKNWRGMQESGGRRIKRAITIDLNSVKFCDQDDLARYSKIDYIKDYIASKSDELEAHNKEHVVDHEAMANGRRLTNVGTFRAYMLAYLQHHPHIHKEMTIMVRQLAATESGLPIEIYAFSAIKEWAQYETIQADIFDHLFAVAREFDLRVFQKPTGADLHHMGTA